MTYWLSLDQARAMAVFARESPPGLPPPQQPAAALGETRMAETAPPAERSFGEELAIVDEELARPSSVGFLFTTQTRDPRPDADSETFFDAQEHF